MAIHGISPKKETGSDSPKVVKFDENQEKAFAIALKKANERKALSFQNKKG